MQRIFLLVTGLILFSLQPAWSQQIETRRDVLYATHDGESIAGDLYVPAAAGEYPVIIAIHGGGWQVGDKVAYQHWGPYLAKRGYALFSIKYRLMKAG